MEERRREVKIKWMRTKERRTEREEERVEVLRHGKAERKTIKGRRAKGRVEWKRNNKRWIEERGARLKYAD